MLRWSDYAGRSTRFEYWYLQLSAAVGLLAVALFAAILAGLGGEGWGARMFAYSYLLGIVGTIPVILPAAFRRFHDGGFSAWWMLLGLIPYLGGLAVFVMLLWPGNRGANRFGPPRGAPSRTRA